VAVGGFAGDAVTSGASNTFIGYNAGTSNTIGNNNVAVGTSSLDANLGGDRNVAVGASSLGSFSRTSTTDSYNTAVGHAAANTTTSGTANTVVGGEANAGTTGSNNTVMGYLAGEALTTGTRNTIVGRGTGLVLTTGSDNTFIGDTAGASMTTGSGNTIIGDYNGNEGGLDIRTANNQVVLSDGVGNPRMHFSSNGRAGINRTGPAAMLDISNSGTTSSTLLLLRDAGGTGLHSQIIFNNTAGTAGQIQTSGSTTNYITSSDYRLKENVVDLTGATTRLKQLSPKRFNFIVDADTTVDGFLAHEVSSIVPEAVTGIKDAVDEDGNIDPQGIDQSKLVPLLVATIKELEARITALENA
jgi:hypothetical protein